MTKIAGSGSGSDSQRHVWICTKMFRIRNTAWHYGSDFNFFYYYFTPGVSKNSIICSEVGCKQFLSREESCGSGSSHCWSADPRGHLMVKLVMSTEHSAKPKSVNLSFESLMVIIEPGSNCRLFSETRPWIQIKIFKNKKVEKIPD